MGQGGRLRFWIELYHVHAPQVLGVLSRRQVDGYKGECGGYNGSDILVGVFQARLKWRPDFRRQGVKTLDRPTGYGFLYLAFQLVGNVPLVLDGFFQLPGRFSRPPANRLDLCTILKRHDGHNPAPAIRMDGREVHAGPPLRHPIRLAVEPPAFVTGPPVGGIDKPIPLISLPL